MNLQERCRDFQTRIGFRISLSELRRAYSVLGISRKRVIPFSKTFSAKLQLKRKNEGKKLIKNLLKAEQQDVPLLFLDETVFVIKQKHQAWSLPRQNVKSWHFNRFQVNLSVVLCINREGLVCYSIQKGYLNVDDYIQFLKKIKKTVGDQRIALFYDGLNIHLHKRAQTFAANNRWIRLQNEAWRSQDNPIEQYIGLIKRHYYKNKIRVGCNPAINEAGKNENEIHLEQMIHQAFAEYRDYDTSRTIDSCMNNIKKRLAHLKSA